MIERYFFRICCKKRINRQRRETKKPSPAGKGDHGVVDEEIVSVQRIPLSPNGRPMVSPTESYPSTAVFAQNTTNTKVFCPSFLQKRGRGTGQRPVIPRRRPENKHKNRRKRGQDISTYILYHKTQKKSIPFRQKIGGNGREFPKLGGRGHRLSGSM